MFELVAEVASAEAAIGRALSPVPEPNVRKGEEGRDRIERCVERDVELCGVERSERDDVLDWNARAHALACSLQATTLTWASAGSGPLAGAERITLRAPASMCIAASRRVRKRPVASITTSAPSSAYGSSARGSCSARTSIRLPATTSAPFSVRTGWAKRP